MRRMSKNALRAVLRRFYMCLGIEPFTSYVIIKKRRHSSKRGQKRGKLIHRQKQGQEWRKNMPKSTKKMP